jgi:hypothetical protein
MFNIDGLPFHLVIEAGGTFRTWPGRDRTQAYLAVVMHGLSTGRDSTSTVAVDQFPRR